MNVEWYGQPAWALESDALSVVMVPGMGAKIVSLVDRRAGFEWLAGPIPGRPVWPVAYGSAFDLQDMAGWDEMFPTIVPCSYPTPGPLAGVPLPDHGEAWSLPWTTVPAAPGDLTLALDGRALPYRLVRSASLAADDTLLLSYSVVNLGDGPMPYLWAAHPQFVAGPDTHIVLPAHITGLINSIPEAWGWGQPETCFCWPEATATDGRRVRLDEASLPSAARARKFFAMPEARPSWTLIRARDPGCWLRMAWDPQEIPYLGLWVDEGAVHSQTVVSPQPTTGWYDSLALAWHKRQVKIVPPGATHRWMLSVRVGRDEDAETRLRHE